MQKDEEYVFKKDEPDAIRLQKSIIRQKNLQAMLNDSQVAVIANPYLVALDGCANIDFVYHDLRKVREDTHVPKEVAERRKENNLRRLSTVQLSKVLNRKL